MRCNRWLLDADGEAVQCEADVTGRLCAAGHQPYIPTEPEREKEEVIR